MWPVTISIPKTREGIILTLVDKYCALSESYHEISSRYYQKKSFRFIYVLLSLLIIRL